MMDLGKHFVICDEDGNIETSGFGRHLDRKKHKLPSGRYLVEGRGRSDTHKVVVRPTGERTVVEKQ